MTASQAMGTLSSASPRSGDSGFQPATVHYGHGMDDAGARVATKLARVIRQFQRGIIFPGEASKAVVSVLAESQAETSHFPDSWELRAALAAMLNPNHWYRSITYFVPPAIGPVEFDVDVGAGWSVGSAPSPLSSSLAVVQLVPPDSDLLFALASFYSSPPSDMWPRLGRCNEIDFEPAHELGQALPSSPRCAVSVEPGPDGILVMAHTIPQVRAAVAHFTSYGLQLLNFNEPAALAILQNTLSSVRQVLRLRREWRGKHPSWGVMPPGLLEVLRCAPKHISEARAWRADSLQGGGGTNAVEIVCDEINRLEPNLRARDGLNKVELHSDDTRVIEIIEAWSETLRDVA